MQSCRLNKGARNEKILKVLEEVTIRLAIIAGMALMIFIIGYLVADFCKLTPEAESVYIPRSELKELF